MTAVPDNADASSRQARAFIALYDWLKDAQKTGNPPPSQKSAEGRRLFGYVFDVKALEGLDPKSPRSLKQKCEIAGALTAVYLDWGGADSMSEAAKSKLLNANYLRYQDEITGLAAYEMRCFAAFSPAFDKWWSTLSSKAKLESGFDVNAMREHVFNLYSNTAQDLTDDQLSRASRERLLMAIAETAPDATLVLTPRERVGLQEMMGAKVGPAMPADLRVRYSQANAGFGGTTCGTICREVAPVK